MVGPPDGMRMQITGGYYADPGRKEVPRPADCGYPIAEMARGSGVPLSPSWATRAAWSRLATVKEQLLYEVHDPAAL